MQDHFAITYHAATVDDVDAILSLVLQLEHIISKETLVNNVKKNIAGEDYHLFVMKENDMVIGFGEIHFMQLIYDENRRARLTAFCIDSKYRNKKLGSQNIFFIELTSNIKRTDAHRFYECNGYSTSSRLFYKKL